MKGLNLNQKCKVQRDDHISNGKNKAKMALSFHVLESSGLNVSTSVMKVISSWILTLKARRQAFFSFLSSNYICK